MTTRSYPSTVLTIAMALFASVPVAAQIVVPSANEIVEGSTQNTRPLGCEPLPGGRWQQVHDSTEFALPLDIEEIRFRQDVDFGIPFGPLVYPDLRIMLSSGAPPVDSLSTTFADNLGPDATVVFDGAVTLESALSTDVPRPFDVVLPLTVAFPYDPADGNLLLDFRIGVCPVGSLGLWFDAVIFSSVARVLADSADATVADGEGPTGMVTQFLSTPIFADGFESGDTSAW